MAKITEDQLRITYREQMSENNCQLKENAYQAGVTTGVDFAIFYDCGYRGLYGGLSAKDIHINKKLRSNQKILDYMGSCELSYNIVRASLTTQKIVQDRINDKSKANKAHHSMGMMVRQMIINAGVSLPEDLPTPSKSIQQLKREKQHIPNELKQLSLFNETLEENV